MRTLFWVEKNVQNVVRHSRILIKLFLKIGTAELIGSAEKCPISSPLRLLIQKCSGLRMKVSKYLPVLLSRHDISTAFKFGELLGGHCSFFNHLRTVLIETLLRDTCNARRALCILLNLPLRLWQQSFVLFNELWMHRLINNFSYCLQQHY